MSTKNYVRIKSLDELKRLTDTIMEKHAGTLLGFDIETGYYGPDRDKGSLDNNWDRQFIVGFSLSPSPAFAAYVPLFHDLGENLDSLEAWSIVKPMLEAHPVVAHNAKFEIKNCRAIERKGHGPRIDLNIVQDTMIDAYVLSEWESTGLKPLVQAVFDHKMSEIESLFPGMAQNKMKGLRFNALELNPQVVAYACEDALWCRELALKIGPMAEAKRPFMRKLEMSILQIMADVEDYGVMIDVVGMEEARSQAPVFARSMEKCVKEGLSEMAEGRDLRALNLGSSKQMKELLYRDMGLVTTRLTKGAKDDMESWQKMSTDAIALEGLSRQYDPLRKLLDMREVQNLSKRLTKWLDEYAAYYPDHRVHPNFGQTIVGTGRFAANDPPIQQCPKEWRWSVFPETNCWDADAWQTVTDGTDNGVEYWNGNFRSFIRAADGYYLLTYDYSQIELRVLAGVSQEPALLKAFNDDLDVHTITAGMMLGKPPEMVNPDTERPVGKTMNFALLYGMGAKSLAERLGLTMDRAKELYAAYFSGFTSISTWMEKARAQGKARGYSETHFGRRYTVWELQSSNNAIYAKGERVLVNAPIQGGAADYMKIAMVRVTKRLKDLGYWNSKCTIIMNQHDSLTFEVSNDIDPNEIRDIIAEQVVFPVKGFPKIVADWELGQTWGGSKKWKSGYVAVWDGQKWALQAAGEPVVAASPLARVEGEEAEDEESLSTPLPVAVELERAPLVPTPEPVSLEREGDGVRLLVELREMPTMDGYARFLKMMSDTRGPNAVVLLTPEGELEIDGATSLGVEDVGKFAMVFPGCSVRQDSATVDASALSAGMTF